MEDRKIILVVDDMSENLTFMRSILQDYFDVRLAKSGKIALELLDNLKVNLILLDIEMPAMSGFELIRRVKINDSINKKTPIIFVTSHGNRDYIDDAIKAGAKDYVLKPVDPDALYKKIGAIIGMPEHKLNSLEGNLMSLKSAVTLGDSVRAESLSLELSNLAVKHTTHSKKYAEDIEAYIRKFDFEKGLKTIESFLSYLDRTKD
jgi:putative two-component system response regulator